MSLSGLEMLDAGIQRLEAEMTRAPIRDTFGASEMTLIRQVLVFPAIPAAGPEIIFLHSINLAHFQNGFGKIPKASLLDTYWWASEKDTEWHPIGGQLVDIVGIPGDFSGV